MESERLSDDFKLLHNMIEIPIFMITNVFLKETISQSHLDFCFFYYLAMIHPLINLEILASFFLLSIILKITLFKIL